MNQKKTVHTSRTIMFAELAKVMDHAIQDDNYFDSLKLNVINKKTKSGIDLTSGYLKKLYSFDIKYPSFKALKYFWQISDEKNKPLLAFLFALGRDYLLNESISVIANTKPGEKVKTEILEENIESIYPKRYSDSTRRSIAQNIASSWKQAGFITGKIKNIRTQPDIDYLVIAFAFLMAYLDGIRGDFILSSIWAKALSLNDFALRELVTEAARRDLLQYQYAGNITSVSFNNLLNKLEINDI